MYTDPKHLRVSDPGHVEGNVVFTYLDIFDPDKKEVEELKEHYQRGGLGDVKLKSYLIDVLDKFLTPIRQRRQDFSEDIPAVLQMLKDGSQQANAVAESTMKEVREAIGVNYFDSLS
ncbi:hypothetical protein Q757_01970 [Oenococcus alcoholitolerans]|uniref:Tryptophan--tRNA ligase n=1 Tax=Oenococcus alcoholitolerans TaxID=931074 RepID=A0ABR4XS75_9LACO|nr:hypothetical protein Q757_01970 [Oenococcus alcoholitolerans]